MITVIPAIIPRSKEQLEDELKLVSGFAPLVQVDIEDGEFVKIKTWPYYGRDVEYFDSLVAEEVGWPEWERTEIEVHFMVKNPETVLPDWIKTGIGSVVVHIEATSEMQKIIDMCREASVGVGIAIKPATDIALLAPYVAQVDFIQCMGNDHLGKHGEGLEESAKEKIKQLHALYPDSIIGIDIGVNTDTAETLVSLGATRLVTGSAILNAERPKEVYEDLMNIV